MTQAELAYSTAAQEVDERERVILEELPQVYYVARRIHERLPQHVPFEDLVHAGILGLMEALRNYDASKKVQLKSFAKFRIRGAILDSLRELDWGSRPLRRKARRVEEAITKLQSELGRYPEQHEIAAEMGIDLAELQKLLGILDGLELVGQQSDSNLTSEGSDLIESAPSQQEDPFAVCLRTESTQRLALAVSKLSEREQLLISLYYREELTMKEISRVLEVAESRVSQMHSLALAKLRSQLCHGAAADSGQ